MLNSFSYIKISIQRTLTIGGRITVWPVSSGQSYKAPTSVNYDSRVVNMSNLSVISTLVRVIIYARKIIIRLTTV